MRARAAAQARREGDGARRRAPALNLELYPEAVTSLVLAEPDPHMIKQLRAEASRRSGSGAEVVEARRRRPALRGRQLRHRRLHPRPLHGPRPGRGPGRDRPRPQARRPAALPRARPRRATRPGQLAGPPREALALPRRRLPLQPRHRGGDRGRRLRARASVERDELPKAPPIVRPLVTRQRAVAVALTAQ